jgi:hypothetical protein
MGDKVTDQEGLDEIILDAVLLGFRFVRFISLAGDHYDGEAPGFRLLLQDAAKLESIHTGHKPVGIRMRSGLNFLKFSRAWEASANVETENPALERLYFNNSPTLERIQTAKERDCTM